MNLLKTKTKMKLQLPLNSKYIQELAYYAMLLYVLFIKNKVRTFFALTLRDCI